MKITIVLYSSFYPFLLLTFVKRGTSILIKMKRIVVVFIINLMLHHNSIGQNLVPNPSFENYSSCPTSPGYIYEAPPWFQPRIWNGNTTNGSSSDFYNACSNSLNPQAGIPSNAFGYQYARTGNGYAGIYVSNGYNYTEYIEVPLSAPLIANRKYCLSFYVSLSAKYWLATSNIGAYFSTDSLLFVSYSPNVIDSVIPQIDNPSSNILNDTANWMLVSGSFIAAGGEKFMTIGNFHDSINATFQSLRDSLEKIDRWQFVEEIEGLKRQLHEKDRQLEQHATKNTTTSTPSATEPNFDALHNISPDHTLESHTSSNHMDIVNELLQLRHSHAVLQTQHDHQTAQIQNIMTDANRALDSIVHLEGHTLHGRHVCASAQCVGWLLSARQGLEAVVSTNGNATTTAENLQTTVPLNQTTDSSTKTASATTDGSAKTASATTETLKEQALLDMCKKLERENQTLTEKLIRLEGMMAPSSSSAVKSNQTRPQQEKEASKLAAQDKANDNYDDGSCGSGK